MEEFIKLYSEGNALRETSITLLNERSSRSHLVITFYINNKDCKGDILNSKFVLVDLAGIFIFIYLYYYYWIGSENISKSGADSNIKQRKEATLINRSLSQLSLVIQAIIHHRPHIPYRDSILTQLLSQSIGGNCMTTMILCCDNTITNKDATLSTLRFGSTAKLITNNIQKNITITQSQLKLELERMKIENDKLNQKLLELNNHNNDENDNDLSLENIEELILRNDELQKTIIILESSNDDKNEQIMNLNLKIKELENYCPEEINRLQMENEGLDYKYTQLYIDYHSLLSKYQTLSGEIKEKEIEIDNIKTEYSNYKAESEELENQTSQIISDLQNKLNKSDVSYITLKQQYESQISYYTNLIHTINKQLMYLSSYNNMNYKINNNLSSEQDIIGFINMLHDKYIDENKENKEMFEELNTKIQEQISTIESLQCEIFSNETQYQSKLHTQENEFETEYNKLNDKFVEYQQVTNSKINTLNSEVVMKEFLLKNKQAELNDLKNDYNSEIENIRKKFNNDIQKAKQRYENETNKLVKKIEKIEYEKKVLKERYYKDIKSIKTDNNINNNNISFKSSDIITLEVKEDMKLKNENNSLKEENKVLKNDIDEMNKKYENKKYLITRFKITNTELSQQLSKYKNLIDDLNLSLEPTVNNFIAKSHLNFAFDKV